VLGAEPLSLRAAFFYDQHSTLADLKKKHSTLAGEPFAMEIALIPPSYFFMTPILGVSQ
jgi:hypothetical protein